MRWNQDSGDKGGGGGRHRQQNDLEDLLKRGQDKFKQMIPPGPNIPGPLALGLAIAASALIAFFAFTFTVKPDELGVVMRFGKPIRQEPPGLHYRLPYPIDEVYLPKVTRQNITEIGLRADQGGRTTSSRDGGLMLTGDENIVDINFVVFWRIQDAMKYLFNIQNPETTVRDVAESAMREIVGRSDIQPLLTGARQKTEQAAHKLMQDVLDLYGSGVHIDQVQLQKVDPPTQVIDAFRDVQAAATDKQRLQNEAASYANRMIPEARGEADRILQGAQAYREQSVAEATGQSARFLKIYDEYKKAPDVTRTRMYLETMERIMTGTDKIIMDTRNGQGIVPYLSLDTVRKEEKK